MAIAAAAVAGDRHERQPRRRHEMSKPSTPTGAPGRRLGEAGPKGFDNAADAITELNKRFKKRLALDNPRFVKHYLESELNLLVRFRVGGI
jgi:hypothetical protein